MSSAAFDPNRWLELLPPAGGQRPAFDGSMSLAPLAPSFLRHSPSALAQPLPFLQQQQPQPHYTSSAPRHPDVDARRYSLPQHDAAPSTAFPSPPLQPTLALDAHQQSDHLARRRHTFEMHSLRGGAGAGVTSEGASGGGEPWQAASRAGHDANGYDFALQSPSLIPAPTVTTPRAPMLVLVADAAEQGKVDPAPPAAPAGMEDEDRAAVKGLLGLGGSTPVGALGAQLEPVTAVPFVDEPLDSLELDHDSSGSDSDDAEGEDDDGEDDYDPAYDARGGRDRDYKDEPDRRRSGASASAPSRFPARALRRGRTASTAVSLSHSSDTHTLTTPPTRSPSPSVPTSDEDDAAPAAHPHKRALVLSGPSARTTALPNKRRYRTSTTSGSGAFRCLHPSADGGAPCPVSFRRSYDLARHRDSKHGDGAKSSSGWRCRTCGGEFARKDSLQRHAANKSHQGLDA